MISSHDLTPILISTEININKFPMSKLLPLWIWFDPSIKKVILKKREKKKGHSRDFPGSVVKTLCFQCRGHAFDPW